MISNVDERVLTGHGGTPETEDTDSFPAVTVSPGGPAGTGGDVPGDSAAGSAAAAASATPAASRWSQLPYAIVVAGVLAGLAWAWQGTAQVRAGMVTVAAALLAAALARLVLPERQAGLLATRHRLLDVVIMLGLGVCILVVALVLPRTA
jgi:DUF3017 family protein